MTAKKFYTLCELVSQNLGLELTFVDEEESRNDAYEDDGTLHVQNGRLRACFDVGNGQSNSASVQNENTENVMRALNLPISSRVLIEVDDDDERISDYDDDYDDGYDDEDEDEEEDDD